MNRWKREVYDFGRKGNPTKCDRKMNRVKKEWYLRDGLKSHTPLCMILRKISFFEKLYDTTPRIEQFPSTSLVD